MTADYDQQDARFAFAFSVLREAISDRAFPAASVAVTYSGKLVVLKSLGKFLYEGDFAGNKEEGAPEPALSLTKAPADFARPGNPEVETSTLFDLASLTKPIATTTMAMILYERGLLELDAPVSGILPEFVAGSSDPRRHEVSFHMLLAHSSGLPAYEKLFLKAHSREELLRAALATPLAGDPGSRAEYSDIGFILLGVALERIAQEKLDTFCQREIFGPLGMSNTTFNPPAELRSKIPPTADERAKKDAAPASRRLSRGRLTRASQTAPTTRSTFRNRIVQGEVQDENAFVLGGVAGQAGLFSTSEDVARFAHCIIACGAGTLARDKQSAESHPLLRPETVALFTRRESSPLGASRALGWDTPSSPSQSGKYFGPHSYGHLGYTGTSLWIDPDRKLSVTLLTNRTWPDCSNQAIKQVRPKFHDLLIEALGER